MTRAPPSKYLNGLDLAFYYWFPLAYLPMTGSGLRGSPTASIIQGPFLLLLSHL